MGTWLFNRYRNGSARNPKEIDQFRNEDSSLAEPLVRESIQNSLDARCEGEKTVRMRFSRKELCGEDARFFTSLFQGDFEKHAKECGIDWGGKKPSVLLVEDYGTTGLKGRTDEFDEKGDFFLFVHGVGITGKRGSKRGRHGLGKVVYPLSSQCRAFFPITLRENETEPLLIGQAVFKLHKLDGIPYEPEAYFGDRGENDFEIPVQDRNLVRRFCSVCGVRREEPGLSVVIPWPVEMDDGDILSSLVTNYYFALLSNLLVADVFGKRIDSTNVKQVAKEVCDDRIPGKFFDFLNEALTMGKNSMPLVEPGEIQSMDEELRKSLRDRLLDGKTVGVRVPLKATRKTGEGVEGLVSLYLKQPPGLDRGHAIYVRDGLVLPEEARRFGNRRAFGLLLSREDAIAELLGDAENPSHRGWNARSEHVGERWRNPAKVIRTARDLLPRLFDCLLENEEIRDETVLNRFFPLPPGAKRTITENRAGSGAGNIPGVKKSPDGESSPSPGLPPPRETPYVLIPLPGTTPGFQVHSTAAPSGRLIIEAGYRDLEGGHRHDPLDFDFTGNTAYAPVPEIKAEGAQVVDTKANRLTIEPVKPGTEVSVEISGFDPHRDLHVKLEREEME